MYQRELYEYLSSGPWPDTSGSVGHRIKRKSEHVGISLEVYDRRVPIYRTTVQFVRTVLKELQPKLQDILQFATDTDEALFLFDDTISEYLAQIFKKALRLRTISLTLSRLPADDRTSLRGEETALALWFSEQFQEIRTRFAPFLGLA